LIPQDSAFLGVGFFGFWMLGENIVKHKPMLFLEGNREGGRKGVSEQMIFWMYVDVLVPYGY